MRKGFTLIELLVVISIIGLLSSVVLASLNTSRQKARDSKRISQIKEIQKALELYFAKYDSYPYGANITDGGGNAVGTEDGRSDSCQNAPSSASGYPLGTWDWAMQKLVDEKFLPSIPRDPLNSGFGDNDSKCFKYASYTSDSIRYKRCKTSLAINPDNNDIPISDYGYVLMFTAEKTTYNLPFAGWPSPIYQYCVLGPHR